MTTTMIAMKDGKIEIPEELRERYGIQGDSLLEVEAGLEEIVIRAADWREPEIYSPERIAEFTLNNVFDAADYARARAEVREMGLDPDVIPHLRPDGGSR